MFLKSVKNLLETIFPSLTKKIAFGVIGIALLAMGTFVFFAQKTGNAMIEQFSAAKAHGILEKVQGVFSHGVDLRDRAYLQGVLILITRSSDITDAYLVDNTGTIIFSAKSNNAIPRFSLEQFKEVPNITGEKYFTQKEGQSFYEYVLTPIETGNPGSFSSDYLILKISVDDLRVIAQHHRDMNILMTTATFLGLALILFLAISFLVIRPILSLHTLVRRIETNINELESGKKPNFPYLPETDSKDELGALSRDFNNLLRHLNDANDKLFDAHQRQLEHADRLASIGEMAASMAHEIKNPIAGVTGALQVFRGEIKDDDPSAEILDEMKVQLDRVNHAVSDLLTYARPRPPQLEPAFINDILRKTLTLLAPNLKGSEITVSISLDESEPMVRGDSKQLQQVFWNIIQNAVQAMKQKGTLTVTSSVGKSLITVSIEDTGPGISNEDIQNVFKPFFTTKHKGTGLGMTISKNIVEQHHGTISLRSIPGKGLTVIITIPQTQPEHP